MRSTERKEIGLGLSDNRARGERHTPKIFLDFGDWMEDEHVELL